MRVINANTPIGYEQPLIEFRGVSKTYIGGTHALSDVNLKINKGEFVFVVGSSGAGKSTFMKLIMREEKANVGDVIVNGYNLSTMKRKQIPMLRRTIGLVFQDFRLIPTMNVFDNVAFAMHVVGAGNRKIRKEVSRALSKVGLGHLIIADEPTGNVDPNMSYEIVGLLDEINKRGTTILMVTHDHNLVRDFHHRVIMLDGGKVVADNAEGSVI